MKIHWSIAVLTTAAVAWGTIPAVAQQRSQTQTDRPQAQTQTEPQETTAERPRQDRATRPSFVFRATDLEGMDVRDDQGRDFGEIEEFLIDWENGRAPYAIVSTGGVLDLDENLFAIPLAVLDYQKKTENQKQFLKVQMSQERLMEAPSFSDERWPTFNAQWQQQVNRFYGVQGAEVAAFRPEQNADQQQEVAPERRHSQLHRSSDMVGATIRNSAGEEIGEIHELVVDIGTGELRYAAVSSGGFLGLGEKLFAVPHRSLKLTSELDGEEFHFVFNVTKEQLENASGFDKDNWPSKADPRWSKTGDSPADVEPRREGTRSPERRDSNP